MVNGLIVIHSNQWVPPTLNLTSVLNIGTIHKEILFFIFLFLPPYIFIFGIFFTKLESTILI